MSSNVKVSSSVKYSPLDADTREAQLEQFRNVARQVFVCIAASVALLVVAAWTAYQWGGISDVGGWRISDKLTDRTKVVPTSESSLGNTVDRNVNQTLIIVITPTYKRLERLADMTRLSQTLMHIKDLSWVVVEDGNETSLPVERILERSGIDYVYFPVPRDPDSPHRGDPAKQRDTALSYVMDTYANDTTAVVYFADDDNSYDLRLFDKYIRNVKTIGLWAVGLVGGALVEAPHVENDTITKWDVLYLPGRSFAVDMAGFAVSIDLIRRTNASFHHAGCHEVDPEPCFLSRLGVPKEKAQAFGYDEEPKDVLVWHTKTGGSGSAGGNYGYITERKRRRSVDVLRR
ncbi:Glycosyltransferase family 43 protein [Aphelenchoides avenae]|nr:Glycosyltransferase family 43 protein [Aphelenchus avenae]